MAFSPLSFLIGFGAAYALQGLSRTFRPLAVEAAAIGMGLFEDARRLVAEQMENFEDITAEARARREQIVTAAAHTEEPDDEPDAAAEEPAVNGRTRRRATRARARTS
jgi:hypothetical protein